ncbi:MAG: cytochrome c [Spirosomaceae bacterium]|jgi:mono/diheme cytochrome c family protein|nr:cytochrome c [Spirosomataceae bacterium]
MKISPLFLALRCCILLWVVCLTACQSSQNTDQQTSQESVAMAAIDTTKSDSMSVYLLDIKAKLTNLETIVVNDDPVFHAKKTYRAVPFQAVMDQFLAAYKNLDLAQTQIVFECEDGYNPSMSLAKVLDKKSYLALSDVDAPTGQEWINPTKEGREMKIAPFYVVYTDVPASDVSFKWPYNLVKISLASASEELAVLFPKEDDTVVKGFELFKTNCLTCHALNKVGGKMGPELNYPKSVTEYWKSTDDIKAFVKAPSSYRHDCKMPAVTHLNDKELDEILRYLTYMSQHKPQKS